MQHLTSHLSPSGPCSQGSRQSRGTPDVLGEGDGVHVPHVELERVVLDAVAGVAVAAAPHTERQPRLLGRQHSQADILLRARHHDHGGVSQTRRVHVQLEDRVVLEEVNYQSNYDENVIY